MKTMSVRRMAFSAAVAAVYAALTMFLAPLSYGPLQLRLSEALCILPFFFPYTAWGLYVGCIIANLLSQFGMLDVVFGSLATLLAGLCSAWLGKKHRDSWLRGILSCLMPVLFNALLIGAIIAVSTTKEFYSAPTWLIFAINALQVGLGEAVVMFAIGLPLTRLLPKQAFFQTISDQINGESS